MRRAVSEADLHGSQREQLFEGRQGGVHRLPDGAVVGDDGVGGLAVGGPALGFHLPQRLPAGGQGPPAPHRQCVQRPVDAEDDPVLPQGADVNALFDIPSREKIGRAKMVPPDDVDKTYDAIIEEMKAEVAEIAERGEEE